MGILIPQCRPNELRLSPDKRFHKGFQGSKNVVHLKRNLKKTNDIAELTTFREVILL